MRLFLISMFCYAESKFGTWDYLDTWKGAIVFAILFVLMGLNDVFDFTIALKKFKKIVKDK